MCGGDAGTIFKWLIGDVVCKNIEESTLLDWEARHRVLLYPFILANKRKLFSPDFLKLCRSNYLKNYARVLQVEHFLQKFNEFLSAHSFHAIVLKGVPVAENYYPDKFTRHSRDVDVLVEQHQVDFIAEWLKLEGFHLDSDYFLYNKKQQEVFLRHNHHFCFHGTNERLPLIVELHWKLRSNDDICNINPFERGYSWLKTSYDHLFTLHHIDQFIYLCVHGTEHGWYRLKWLLDLSFLCQRINLEWDCVKARAHELNALEHVELSLYLIHHFTGKILIPGAEIHSFNKDIKIKVSKLLSRINQSALIETGYLAAVRQILFLSSFNNRKWRLNFWMKWSISPADWKSFPLPNCLFFLYYPMRPIFWLIRKSFR
jgi:Uncharacterised nucleotidyltransferase